MLSGLAPGKYRIRVSDEFEALQADGGEEIRVEEGQILVMELKAAESQ